MTTIEIATIVALVTGPVLAVLIARWIEYRRTRHERRMDIFRTLMRTRRSRLFLDHVSALNLVEIEFRDDSNVKAACQSYLENLGSEQPRRADEEVAVGSSNEERQIRDERYNTRVGKDREKLLATLLHAMAQTLGYKKVEALDIFEGGYSPQGWADIEVQQEAIRRYVIDLYLGNRALPVVVYNSNAEPSSAADVDMDTKEEPRRSGN